VTNAVLQIDRSTFNHVKARVAACGFLPSDFLGWKQAVEFELAENPSAKLRLVKDGNDSFYEYRFPDLV
jgi:hypothetical protein